MSFAGFIIFYNGEDGRNRIHPIPSLVGSDKHAPRGCYPRRVSIMRKKEVGKGDNILAERKNNEA